MNDFKQLIIKNLDNNGFPQKRVSLPLEKLYESADNKGLNLNTILDELTTEGICHEKTDDKIIFFHEAPVEQGSEQGFGQGFSGMGDPQEMMKQAQEMMSQMDPQQLKEMQEKVANMSEEEKAQMMEQAKKMGLF